MTYCHKTSAYGIQASQPAVPTGLSSAEPLAARKKLTKIPASTNAAYKFPSDIEAHTGPSHPNLYPALAVFRKTEDGRRKIAFVDAWIKSIDPDSRDMTEFAALYSPAKGGCCGTWGTRTSPSAPKILFPSMGNKIFNPATRTLTLDSWFLTLKKGLHPRSHTSSRCKLFFWSYQMSLRSDNECR